MVYKQIRKKKKGYSFLKLTFLIFALIISVPITSYFKNDVLNIKSEKTFYDFVLTLMMSIGIVLGFYLSYVFYRGEFEESLSGNASSSAAIEAEFLVTITFIAAYLLLFPFFLIFKLFGRNIYQEIKFKNNLILSVLAGFFCSMLFCIVLSTFILLIN